MIDITGTPKGKLNNVSGVVHVIREESEIERFREGEILVATSISPEWTAALALAKGIIATEEQLNPVVEAVVQARGLPVTVGVINAMELRSGEIVTMQADGNIAHIDERREPDSPMRVSVPAAVASRELAEQVNSDPNVIVLPYRDDNNTNDTPAEKKTG